MFRNTLKTYYIVTQQKPSLTIANAEINL